MDSQVPEFTFRKGAGGDCGFGVTAYAVNCVPYQSDVKSKAVECLFQIFDPQIDFQMRAFFGTGGHLGLPFFVLSLRLLLLVLDSFAIFVIFGRVDGIFQSLAVWNESLGRSRFVLVVRCSRGDGDGLVKSEHTLLA